MSDIDTQETLDDHLRPAGAASSDPEYLAWKTAKIKRALVEATDRSKMIPAHKVWEEFGLER